MRLEDVTYIPGEPVEVWTGEGWVPAIFDSTIASVEPGEDFMRLVVRSEAGEHWRAHHPRHVRRPAGAQACA